MTSPVTGDRLADGLAHRRLVAIADLRPSDATGLFDRIGGRATVDRLVDLLYDGIERDSRLRPLFPRDLAAGRAGQKAFFADWFDGPPDYSDDTHSGLVHRHEGLPIDEQLAGRWLGHFRSAVAATVPEVGDRRSIVAAAQRLAQAFIDPTADGGAAMLRRSSSRAAGLARRGDLRGLESALTDSVHLLRPVPSATVMHAAAIAGRADSIRVLLDAGVSADRPHYLPVGVAGSAFERIVFVAPVCSARMKNRAEAERVLVEAGAVTDVFTNAYLADLPALRRALDAAPGLAHALDPATDVVRISPIEHAVAGGRLDALELLLDAGGPAAGTPSVRALRGAAERADLAMVELLLSRGANATRLGAGRWVTHTELASTLSRHGARVDQSGSWIGLCCTGNQGRRDDPDYVRALLHHGARADDRRRRIGDAGTTVDALDATALHFAAKAGFIMTIDVLLDNGADPRARDARGRTPLDWLDEATAGVDRSAVESRLRAR